MENNSIEPSKMATTVATEGEGVSVAADESVDHQQQQHVLDDDDCAEREKSSGQSDDDPSVFYFESDHLALKGNPDYLKLMATLVNLEAVKVKAIQDIDSLYEAKLSGLSKPHLFVQQLQSGKLNLPRKLRIPDVPEVDWSIYKLTEEARKRPLKRTAKQTFDDDFRIKEDIYVRGRVYKSDKPRTFNQPWRTEEQQRLEELLEIFPTEEVEMERWKKIAKELGNRTPVQVQSRVQKYFLKLQRAGLPIPGRKPSARNNNRYLKPALKKRFSKQPLLLSKKSTFLASVVPPVRMEENEDDEEESVYNEPIEQDQITNSDKPEEYGDEFNLAEAAEDKDAAKLQLLERVRAESLAELKGGLVEHEGFKCSHCTTSPILGTRWHCTVCSVANFCNLCIVEADHEPGHTLRIIKRVES